MQKGMSALPLKADMCGATRDVRFVPKADIDQYPIVILGRKKRDRRGGAVSSRSGLARFAQAAAALASAFRKASRSALIVAASVVGMPCGKPL